MAGGRDWCINIVLTDPDDESSSVTFQPDVPGGTPGAPLQAQATDLVGWNNRTPGYHQINRADAGFQPVDKGELTDEIEPWQNSTSSFLVSAQDTGTTIFYVCKIHPSEHGTIVVS